MKKTSVVLFVAILFMTASAAMAEQAPQKVVDIANTTLASYGSEGVIVAAVQAANTSGQTLDQVKAKDEKWRATAGMDDTMRALTEGACGQFLRGLQKKMPYIEEIFVMDHLGANVAMTDKTSDYWQGDEAKFQKSYAAGAGAVFVDEVEFDDSAQAYLVQVSVPVMDGGKAIGAVTFGINVDKID
jgi:opacity protein-like surface antigen